MYPYIRCSNCNTSIGEYIELYNLMKNYLYDIELKKLNINVNDNNAINVYNNIQENKIKIETKPIFDLLNIHNYCCKKKILTNVVFNDKLYS